MGTQADLNGRLAVHCSEQATVLPVGPIARAGSLFQIYSIYVAIYSLSVAEAWACLQQNIIYFVNL